LCFDLWIFTPYLSTNHRQGNTIAVSSALAPATQLAGFDACPWEGELDTCTWRRVAIHCAAAKGRVPFCEVEPRVGGALAGRRHSLYAHASRWQFNDYNSSVISICLYRRDPTHPHLGNKLSRKMKPDALWRHVRCWCNPSSMLYKPIQNQGSVTSGPRAACDSTFWVEPQTDFILITERDLEQSRFFF